MDEISSDIAVAQVKAEIPLSGGFSLPISITYANRTELINEDEIRGNIGISFDMDKLYALTKLLALRK